MGRARGMPGRGCRRAAGRDGARHHDDGSHADGDDAAAADDERAAADDERAAADDKCAAAFASAPPASGSAPSVADAGRLVRRVRAHGDVGFGAGRHFGHDDHDGT